MVHRRSCRSSSRTNSIRLHPRRHPVSSFDQAATFGSQPSPSPGTLEVIKHQIQLGTFSFADEFPDYRFLPRLSGAANVRLCNDVFDDYLTHSEARLERHDLAAATVRSYQKILHDIWRPASAASCLIKSDTPVFFASQTTRIGARRPTTT
jgi:hypothetical protein